MPASPPRTPLRTDASTRTWDLFCRVIDNFGDIGVSLRLARDLASRGEQVRLWCDDLSALSWMQPTPVANLSPLSWSQSECAVPGDVVVETFGCELPPTFIGAMAAQPVPPVWINLEYLSAETYVERSHGLQSPQMSGPGRGLNKWFFYPGFTERTGGLLREPGLIEAADALDGVRWLDERGWAPSAGERVMSVFAYPQAPLADLLASLEGPWLLLLCPGEPQRTVPPLLREGQRAIALPHLSQTDYDRLLAACDLNLVRGEDSFVRAQWAGAPMLWQIYFQDDGAHGPKLDAFLRLSQADAPPDDRGALADWAALSRAWNGLAPWPATAARVLQPLDPIREQARRWRAGLAASADLTTALQDFATRKAGVSS